MKTSRHAWLIVALMAMAAPDEAASQPVRLGSSLKSIQIHRVPPPPGGGDWDGGIIRNLFLGSVAGIYPDIEICVGYGGRVACSKACTNAQLHPDDPEKHPPTVCKVTMEGRLIIASRLEYPDPPAPERTWLDLAVTVNEFDATLNAQPKRPMGRFSLYPNRVPLLPTPERCTESSPCTLPVEQFMVSFVTEDAGSLGTSGTRRDREESAPPPSPPPGTQKPGEESSYYDRFKKWLDDFIWNKAKEQAGFRGTVLEGLAKQAEIANDKYAERLVAKIEEHELGERLEKVCVGKTGKEAASCAYQVLAEDYPADAQWAQTGELTVGFLANMWKSVCGVFKMTCN